MGASSPQVHPIINRQVLQHPHSLLHQARQVSICRGVTAQSPVRRGQKVANPPGGGRKPGSPSRGEVGSSVYQHSNTGTQLLMAMFVSRLPVGMPRSELEKAVARSARGGRDLIIKTNTEYKY